jgi:hypothetical protein
MSGSRRGEITDAAGMHQLPVYRVRAPRGPCSQRTEYSRTAQSVCWQRGGVGRLRNNCREGFPQKYSPERNQPRLEKQIEETEKKATVWPLMPPRYALSVSGKRGHDSLHAEGRIGEKACLVTTAGLPERDPLTRCPLQTASGEILHISREVFV